MESNDLEMCTKKSNYNDTPDQSGTEGIISTKFNEEFAKGVMPRSFGLDQLIYDGKHWQV